MRDYFEVYHRSGIHLIPVRIGVVDGYVGAAKKIRSRLPGSRMVTADNIALQQDGLLIKYWGVFDRHKWAIQVEVGIGHH